MILSCKGGGGHTAVANALLSYLGTDYDIMLVADVFTEVISFLDPVYTLSWGRTSCIDFYNYLLPRKWYRTLSWYYVFGSYYTTWRQKKITAYIEKYLQQHKPDLVISVVPVINHAIAYATQNLNIPFLLLPTDLDINIFLNGINNPSFSAFTLATAFEDGEARQRAVQAQVPMQQVSVTGFVIRPDFFEEKNKHAIKTEYSVPHDKPVILLLLGALGLDTVPLFTEQLTKIHSPAHILVCTGRRDDLKDTISKIPLPAHITLTIIGFTERMSDLMSIADLFITKSGSVSVCEAVYMNLPMIIDATSTPLSWEYANHRFIKRHSFGTLIKQVDELPSVVSHLLQNKDLLATYKNNLIKMPKKHGGIEIRQLIEKML